MTAQGVLPGCEGMFAPAWQPSADDPGPRRLLELLGWFHRTLQDVFPSLKYLGRKLGASTRTVKRWLAALRAAGKVTTRRRGPHSLLFRLEGHQCTSEERKNSSQLSYKDGAAKEGPKEGPSLRWWRRFMNPVLSPPEASEQIQPAVSTDAALMQRWAASKDRVFAKAELLLLRSWGMRGRYVLKNGVEGWL